MPQPRPSASKATDGRRAHGEVRSGHGYAERRVNLLKLARRQRATLFVLMVYMLLLGGMFIAANLGAGSAVMQIRRVWLVSAIVLSVCVMRWAMAMRVPPFAVLLGTALSLLPVLNLVGIAVLNSDTRAMLRRVGVRAGLLGVTPAQWELLRHGVCGACGYDLRGLPNAVCPECGLRNSA